jgi:uncharacterized SAM-dependent methyltransferase
MEKITRKNSSERVNDAVFRELIKRGYSVEGKNKVWNIADSKLWYLTSEQARAFLDLEKKDLKQRMFAKKEESLLKEKFSELTSGIKDKYVTIIDLGCGNGEKALSLIRQFKDKSKIRYCPIDINGFMVEQALKNFSKHKGINILKFKNNVLDFVDFGRVADSLEKDKFSKSYILLLGGNLENSDVHELLHEIRSAMHEGDYLLIGNKLAHPDPLKMVQYYNHSKHIDYLLVKTLEQLGFHPNELNYGARFRGNRVEVLYTVKNDKTISSKGKTVEFKAGDKIIVIFSYKYTQDSLKEVLMMYFDSVEVFPSKDGIFALALCKK